MNASTTAARLATHVSLDTDDLARASAFYRALLGVEPVLDKPDYVRFGPGELGLVLGLNARRASTRGTGAVQHLGFLFPDAETLLAARERLAAAGFPTTGAEHVECCYAELDQFWATDPSGVRWELFFAHEEVVEAPARAGNVTACCAPSCCS
jgi:catechol 2,3-dioxygenase-like lactoylglutathione lyase family enzyme